MTKAANDSRETSPQLSSVSPSPPTMSPNHQDNRVTTPIEAAVKLAVEYEDQDGSEHMPPISCDYIQPMESLDAKGEKFLEELYNIEKDIPRCDRDYWCVRV